MVFVGVAVPLINIHASYTNDVYNAIRKSKPWYTLLMQNHANSYSNWHTQELKSIPLTLVILFQDAKV